MVFNDARFVLLFSMTALAFYVLPVRWRSAILILSGVLFYGWYARPFVPLVVGLVLLTYWASGRVGVMVNIGALLVLMGYFKMKGGAGTLDLVTASRGVDALAFPLGLSFLTFELMHFAIERQRGTIPRARLAEVAAFALFFPCRMAGPIKRYQPFAESVRRARWSSEQLYRGAVRILWGFMKKVVFADVLALIVPELQYASSPLQVWKGLVAYAFYIYLDFSAYSDIAIGLSWLLGVQVPENFRAPYLSRNIREFWSRWHMSLSSWLGDYVFLPLSRRLTRAPLRATPRLAVVLGYLGTFVICGLWHGPTLNFALWGLYHGILLSAYALYAASRMRRPWLPAPISAAVSMGGTFLAVTYGWVFFALAAPKALLLSARLMGITG